MIKHNTQSISSFHLPSLNPIVYIFLYFCVTLYDKSKILEREIYDMISDFHLETNASARLVVHTSIATSSSLKH